MIELFAWVKKGFRTTFEKVRPLQVDKTDSPLGVKKPPRKKVAKEQVKNLK